MIRKRDKIALKIALDSLKQVKQFKEAQKEAYKKRKLKNCFNLWLLVQERLVKKKNLLKKAELLYR